MPASQLILFAASPSRKPLIIGIPPATLLSNAKTTLDAIENEISVAVAAREDKKRKDDEKNDNAPVGKKAKKNYKIY